MSGSKKIEKEIEDEEISIPFPPTTSTDDPLLLSLELDLRPAQRKKRWHLGIEVEYDPIQNIFVDAATGNQVHALLDSDNNKLYLHFVDSHSVF